MYNRGREKVNSRNGFDMDASLLNAYRQLHLELSERLDGHTSTALVPLDHNQNGIVPSLPMPVPPVIRMVQDGWGHDEVPVMMQDVMRSVHHAVTTLEPEKHLVWKDAAKCFVEMVKVTVETLKPSKGNGFHITNNVMLDTLRDVRI